VRNAAGAQRTERLLVALRTGPAHLPVSPAAVCVRRRPGPIEVVAEDHRVAGARSLGLLVSTE
jgi:hypothetical protein